MAELSDLPDTLGGAKQSLELHRAFAKDYDGFVDRPAVQSFQKTYLSVRTRILAASLAEWKQLLSAKPTADEIQSLRARVLEIFPSTERSGLRSEYEEVLTAALKRQQQQDSTVAAQHCDRLAAHPQDPEATAAGVADGKLDIQAALKACELASKQDSVAPRIRFQLARAYLGTDRVEDAIEQLVSAAEEGHGAALAYLADLHLDGAPGIDASPELAYALYERAAEAGFLPAKTILAEFTDASRYVAEAEQEEQAMKDELKKTNPELFQAPSVAAPKAVDPEKIDFKAFFAPVFAEITYAGQAITLFNQLKSAKPEAFFDERDQILEYFDTALVFLQEEQIDPACRQLVEPHVYQSLRSAINMASDERRDRKSQPQAARAPNDVGEALGILLGAIPGMSDRIYYNHINTARQAGQFDMGTLIYEYGGCEDIPVTRFYKNAKAFILRMEADMKRP